MCVTHGVIQPGTVWSTGPIKGNLGSVVSTTSEGLFHWIPDSLTCRYLARTQGHTDRGRDDIN